MDLSAHGNATTPACLDSHHRSAVSKETEAAEPPTACEFQRPSAAEDLMQPWQKQQPPQRLCDQEHPQKQNWLFPARLHINAA